MQGSNRWMGLIALNVVAWSVLSFSGTTGAAPKGNPPPFANPVEQSNEVIRELRDIKTLLQEQNALLRSNAVRKTDGQPTASKNETKR